MTIVQTHSDPERALVYGDWHGLPDVVAPGEVEDLAHAVRAVD